MSACMRSESLPANASATPEKTPGEELLRSMKALEPFFKPMGKPGPTDWLFSHTEPGQTFAEYIESGPTLPTVARRKLYILPLGSFTPAQTGTIKIAAQYLEAFYGLPVEQLPAKAFAPAYPHVRENRSTHMRQIKTGYILNDVLPPMLPGDGAALLAFTALDLYPDESMNFVFGQASFDKRVGVISLYRLKDPAGSGKLLRRVLKIAAHETGHMFSLKHCTKYQCLMNGSNHLAETDSHPIDACPECMAKIAWLSGIAPVERCRSLERVCRRIGLTAEADQFRSKVQAAAAVK